MPSLRKSLRDIIAPEDELSPAAATSIPGLREAIEEILQGPSQLPPLNGFAERAHPGVLATIGRVLDFPGRVVRRGLTGMPEPSGRDVLEKFGLLGRNKPGFDVGDLAGFAAEVGLDPLTYLGGLGALTKTGKLAKTVSETQRELKYLRGAARRATSAEEAVEKATQLSGSRAALKKAAQELVKLKAPIKLGEGYRRQAELGQRALLAGGVPFGAWVPVVRGAGTLGALEPVLRRISTSRPVMALRGRLDPSTFYTQTGELLERAPEARPFFEAAKGGKIRAALESGDISGDLRERIARIAQETGKAPEEIQLAIQRGRESLGKVEGIEGTLADLEAERERLLTAQGGRELGGPQVPRGPLGRVTTQIEELLPKLQARREAVSQAGPALPVAQELSQRAESLLGEEILSGATDPANVLRAETVAYAERVLTAEARELMRKKGLYDRFVGRLSRVASTKLGSQVKREEEILEVFTDEADTFIRENLPELKGHWFEFDPSRSFPQRYASGKMAVEDAKLATGLIETFGKNPHVPGQTISTAELIYRGPLHRFRGVTMPTSGSAEEAIPRIERALEEIGWGGRGVPRDIAEEYIELRQRVLAPQSVEGLIRAFDTASGFWRAAVTLPFPAFHMRNLFSDSIMSFLGGGASPTLIPQAFQAARNPETIRRLESLGVLRGTSARAVLQDIGQLERRGKIVERAYERFPVLEKAAQKGEKLSQQVENFTRTWHFLSMKAKGMTDMQAARSVRRWLLDYSELTDFERQVLRRAFFFYQWPKKILPRLLEGYLQNTGRAALLTRATTQPTAERDVPVPEYVRRGAAIPAGTTREGDPRFIVGTGSPLEELAKYDLSSPEGGVVGAFKGFLRQGGSQLNPFLRIPAELGLGREFYRDRDIIESDRADKIIGEIPGLREAVGAREERLPGGRTRLRADPYLLYLLRSQPLSRFGQSGAQLANVVGGLDTRSSRFEDLLRFLSGVKTVSVDPYEQAKATQDILKREGIGLQREGVLREFQDFFAPGPKGERDPRAVKLLLENREVQEILKRLREEAQRQ